MAPRRRSRSRTRTSIQAAYGAATLADMDGDGRLDIVFGGHGAGPAIAFNKGGGTFKIETRGLPRQMSTRAIAAGDLNGDGRQDLLVISDDPEWIETGGKPQADTGSGYVKGYDVRAFLNDGARFREVHKGLEGACFGYAIALVVPKDAKDGLPFYSSACRYTIGRVASLRVRPEARGVSLRGRRRGGALGPAHGVGGGHLPRPARGVRDLVQALALRRDRRRSTGRASRSITAAPTGRWRPSAS